MFCSRCGSEITGKSKFCPSCGLDLMATTPAQAVASGQLTEVDIVQESLKGEYDILEELGRGGMALVYRGRDRELEREVAIKVLPFSLAFDAEFVERFQREARTSAQLEHPNIIPIYRVGRAGRVIYFTMKYLRGGSLSTILTERQRLSPPDIRRLLLEAGNALGYAAQRGIVHRDIKPDNIMFDEFGQVLLTDFGIAKAASGQKLTGTGMSIGTPHYMSPEQARAQAIDGRSDIYSLGIVAYQCLAGVVPYDGEDSFSIGYKHITEPIPTPPLATVDERRIYEVIKRMLMKAPLDRFQSCEELTAALRGQPTASPGSVRAGGAALPPLPLPPPPPPPDVLANQPTTPLSAPSVNRRQVQPERRSEPRRIADRSRALRGSGDGSRAWVWLVLAALGIGGGGYYYYAGHGFASPQRAVPPDSLIAPTDSTAGRMGVVPAESAAGGTLLPSSSDSTEAPARADGGARLRAPAVSVATPPPTADSGASASPPDAARPAAAADSGSITVFGLPIGSSVLIDERPVVEAVTRVRVGPHVVAVSAPRFDFFADTVAVGPRDTVVVRPALTRLGAPLPFARRRLAELEMGRGCNAPTLRYNTDNACFDVRPLPKAPTYVPLPADADGRPRSSVLWIHVSAAGATLEVRSKLPSNDPAFERAARDFALALAWRPAMKSSQAVAAWTQWKFDPQRP